MAHSQCRWPTEAASPQEATFTHAKTHIIPGAVFRQFELSAVNPIDVSLDMPITTLHLCKGIAITILQREVAYIYHILNPTAAALEPIAI